MGRRRRKLGEWDGVGRSFELNEQLSDSLGFGSLRRLEARRCCDTLGWEY